jgi:hypothetical protein
MTEWKKKPTCSSEFTKALTLIPPSVILL